MCIFCMTDSEILLPKPKDECLLLLKFGAVKNISGNGSKQSTKQLMIKHRMTLSEKFKNILQILMDDILHLSTIRAIISVNYYSPKVMLIKDFCR